MKIIFFEITKEEQDFFSHTLKDMDVSFYEEKLNENNINKVLDAEIISVFTNSVIDKNIIDSLPNLKLINFD